MTQFWNRIRQAWIGLVLVSLSSAALSALLGNAAQLHPVLADLVSALDAKGIDVAARDAATRPVARHRVAMLSDVSFVQPASFRREYWMLDFVTGQMGFVAGAKTGSPDAPGTARVDLSAFDSDWTSVPPEKRIFISFTSADVDAAGAVAAALRERGYATFVFIKSGAQGPRFTAEVVGRFFQDAGHYVVLDSKNARESHGVWLEASIAQRFKGGNGGNSPDKTPPIDPTTGRPFDAASFTSEVRGSWVVTENSDHPGTLFVHRSQTSTRLIDLLYYVKVQPSGSWIVYKPSASGSLGTRLGMIARPAGVDIGPCGCLVQ